MVLLDSELNSQKIKKQAKGVLDIESKAILNLKDSINGQFVEIVKEILNCPGRVIMTGMGKSGLIAKKLAATLASTGTPSFFLHPAEAIHGDLGMVTNDDIVITLSNSGETNEVLNIVPAIKRIGAKIIAMTGGLDSNLAKNADYVLNTGVKEEACPLDLAPTASTTATLALGDALAIALLKVRDFKPEDFALYHPGGSLGKKLLLKVDDVLNVREQNPVVNLETNLKETLFTMTSTGMGAVNIVGDDGKLAGIITDGDIRRHLEESPDLLYKKAGEIMTVNPKTIHKNKLAAEALKVMQDNEIEDLPVVNENAEPLGLINFQDLLKAGVL
ncbi:KpsF/GutQ family sugar-phosphate isomerase [Halanaerobium congolense]|uniref:Arabinose-5-phosphate isomerase n=1 Tax=Halanaerobium congolense TaxID=54121 RepID=A0A4R7DZV2_9FIRM|nr:KpsF/GutQ family sugar-phosphate isomerase [Halanaerobium congolense]TDS28043.1 arabinose-5-phosphate isomerase [Halanaerobium congolense]SDH60529.1 arabinose-5-phosphate isomerase [Halanaerobium congolense]